MVIFEIPLPLMGLNEYTNKQRTHWSKGAKAKKRETKICEVHIKNAMNQGLRLVVPCHLRFTWYCKDKRQDPDNIAFQKKFILDGMVQAKLIPDDGWNQILGFKDCFEVDRKHPRVVIECY